jgi:hypothetical protein
MHRMISGVILLGALLVLGAGCSGVTNSKLNAGTPSANVNRQVTNTQEPSSTPVVKNESKHPLYISNFSAEDDCYFNDVYYYGGFRVDLLQDMQTDFVGDSNVAKPKFYTPEHIKSISQTIATSLAKTNQKFRALTVCHLASGLDVLSGIVWPMNKSWDDAHETFLGEDKNSYRILILDQGNVAVVNSTTFQGKAAVDAGLFMFGASRPPGGGSPPCHADLVNSNIDWKCYVGYEPNKVPTEFGNDVFKTWTISRSGKVLGVKESKELSDIK